MWTSSAHKQQQQQQLEQQYVHHRRSHQHQQQMQVPLNHARQQQQQQLSFDSAHCDVDIKLEAASPPQLEYVGDNMADIEAVHQAYDDQFKFAVPQQQRHHQRHYNNRHLGADLRHHQHHHQQQQQPMFTNEYLIQRRSTASAPIRRHGAKRSYSSEKIVIHRNVVVDYGKDLDGISWSDIQQNEHEQRGHHTGMSAASGRNRDIDYSREMIEHRAANRQRHVYSNVNGEHQLSRNNHHRDQAQQQYHGQRHGQSAGVDHVIIEGNLDWHSHQQFQKHGVGVNGYNGDRRERQLQMASTVRAASEVEAANDDSSLLRWSSRRDSQVPCTGTAVYGSDMMDAHADHSSMTGIDDTATTQSETDGDQLPPLSKPRVEEELCLICGDRASGYHYNALSCEGCKGFFRRSVTRNSNYVCKYGGNCEMDMWMRRKCQACRLKQCRMVGMKEECLLSERQCVARNARRQTHSKSNKPPGPRHRQGTTSGLESKKGAAAKLAMSMDPLTPGGSAEDRQSPGCGRSPLDQLSEEHRELVSRIVGNQDKFELPSPDDIAKVKELEIASSMAKASPSDAVFGHMVEMTILVTRLVVEFAKRLPGFQSLSKGDQIALLKGSASEVMMLRTARRFDPETNTVVFGDGTPFTQNCMAFGGLQGFVDSMFEFSRGMASIGVDNAEYALVTALCIFSDRPGVTDQKAVQNIQEVYSEVLLAYISQRRICASHFLAKLLMKLVELRTLSFDHSNCLYRLTIEKGSLPPLLSEYFDIPHKRQPDQKQATKTDQDQQTEVSANMETDVESEKQAQLRAEHDVMERVDEAVVVQ